MLALVRLRDQHSVMESSLPLHAPLLDVKPRRSLRVLTSDPGLPLVRKVDRSPGRLPAKASSDSDLYLRGTASPERSVAAEMDMRYRLLAKGFQCSADDRESEEEVGAPSGGGVSSEVATVLVILKAFVGGTMLVLPASLLQTGLVAGNITLWAVALLELWGMFKLLEAHRSNAGGSFGQLAQKALGNGGSVAVEVSIVLSQLGFTAAEMIYVAKSGAFVLSWLATNSDLAAEWLGEGSQDDWEPNLVWIQLVLAIPVSWYRDLSALTIFNVVGNLLIFGALLVLSAVTTTGLWEQGPVSELRLASPLGQLITFAGFSVFAFEGITMVIPIYVAHKNKDSFTFTLGWTIMGITALFSIFASANVVLYGDVLEPIVTLNLPSSSILRVWVSCAFALGSLTLVFLMAFPTYEIIETNLSRSSIRWVTRCAGSRSMRTAVVTLCAVLARFGGSSLDLFISGVGAIGCVPLAFVYPAAIHYCLVAETKMQKVGDVALFIFGIIIMINCTAALFV